MSRREKLRSYALARLTDSMVIAGLETSGGQQTHAALVRDLEADPDSPDDLQYVGARTPCSRSGAYYPAGGGMAYTYDELPELKLYRAAELLREQEALEAEQRKLSPLGNLDPFNRVGPVSCSPCWSALHNITRASS
ncbi:hypothetical protein [Actinomadura sp. NPDC049753]|uniref:hypothetical protein n=1 Tax=Actinomadura sp. NPDC049753 TaxID=3154739 RepID=UPI0034284B67